VSVPVSAADQTLDPERLRRDFPSLTRTVNGRPLAYLDSASTSQRPSAVLAAMRRYAEEYTANVHRGVYTTAEEATAAYETARDRLAAWLGVAREEVVFVRNATEGLNLVAMAYGRWALRPGDAVLLTEMEHHSNLVPWQRLAEERELRLEFLPVTDGGELDLGRLDEQLGRGVRLAALTHVSNVLGTVNPVSEIAARCHAAGAMVVVDAAQSVPHMAVNVRDLGADFLVFSGHKMCGPTGIGVLVGRRDLLEAMPPFLTGGDMIRTVHLRSATWNDLPWKFEAGTPSIAGAIGLGAAVDYLTGVGMPQVSAHSALLSRQLAARLADLPGVTVYGSSRRLGVVSFNVNDIHPHDLASILDRHGVAIRAGHHCAQPLMERFGVPAMARASVYLYNDSRDLDRLVEGVADAQRIFGVGR
jgi:cysteine desulfurase/selenocysteine lyase